MIFTRIKRFFIGEPLSNQAASGEKLSKKRALAILSSDALSSVAYATEEMLIPLLLISMAAMTWSIPVAIAIATLLVIVTVSYRQTIEAYPNGGGAYIVARENLGIFPGLIAGASLLIDYILTVAVSVAAGVAALTSAFPALTTHQVAISIVIVLLIMVMNLRGIRESSTVFSVPTYFFIFSLLTLIVWGGWKIFTGEAPMVAPLIHETYPEISIFLVFKAFSSGCAALTGIEAISNGVTAFRPPEAKNAKATMAWMSFILAGLFLGVTLLVHVYGIHPVVEGPHETVVSLLAKSVFGTNFFYYAIQFSTTMILVLAANTSYTGFPILASLLAKDRFLPRQLANIGDKLVFSNGIMGLSFVAIFLLIFFQASTHRLIPLYAIGVFLSFTLSQAGMVVHHFRGKRPGWLRALVFNGIGATATLIVLLVIS
ncbi:MAG: APC family permease, partial [Bdellovibrio sp.]|nr:APC family permease [Bdellovibrio sp.]